MKLQDMRAGWMLKFTFSPLNPDFKPMSGPGDIVPGPEESLFLARQGDAQTLCRLAQPSRLEELNYYLRRRNPCLMSFMEADPEGNFEVVCRFYGKKCLEMGNIEIGLDEKLVQTVNKSKLGYEKDLRLEFLYGEGEPYFCMLPSGAVPPSFGANVEFALVGKTRILPVARSEYQGRKLFLARHIFRDSTDIDSALILARGNIEFKDYATAGAVGALASEQLKKLYQERSSYLAAWDKYNAAEGKSLLKRAREVGQISYNHCEEQAQTYTFFIKDIIPDTLQEGDALFPSVETPPYLKNPNMTWEEWFDVKKFEDTPPENTNDEEKQPEQQYLEGVGFKIARIDRASKLIDVEKAEGMKPASSGFLFLSMMGDAIQVRRRLKARNMVLTGRSANPYLGVLIEEQGELPPLRNMPGKLAPLSPYVVNKIFPHGYTSVQEEAISIALNTPDIALIQGPPGTGKTTVIRAILERLNEILDTSKARGSILVSSFQHDAVNNLLDRLSINGLPPIKFGGRQGFDGSERQDDWMRSWSSELAAKIRGRHPNLKTPEQWRVLDEKYQAYINAPVSSNEKAFLKFVLSMPAGMLNGSIVSKAEQNLAELESRKNPVQKSDHEKWARIARNLRSDICSYEDDGQLNAMCAAASLPPNLVSAEDKALLEMDPAMYPGGLPAWLSAVGLLRDRILAVLSAPAPFPSPRPKEYLLKMYADIRSMQRPGEDKVIKILLEYLGDIENNPAANLRVLEDASLVYGATVQQSAGKQIKNAKSRGMNADEARLTYDTVIIDEAARSSPPDLLIPMSQAAKRIILVGDQNQLPHIIDEELARNLENGETTLDMEALLKESMFGHLFHRLKKLEQTDRARRTITLDTQYRMHPLLGEFVSQNFYNGMVKSGRPPSDFAHALPDVEGSPCAWMDLPLSSGACTKQGTSWIRAAEAKAIISRLKAWLDDSASADLTFGVISFYRAQADLIEREALEQGIYEISGGRRFLAPQYGKNQDRIRINTVDAFQGMEFDVVFLSMVRSMNLSAPEDLPLYIRNEPDEKKRLGKIFGHLMHTNRLCVSLSRQKRLLVIAGDAAIARSPESQQAIPALANFLKLCESKGTIL